MKKIIYLDNNATSPVAPEAVEAMLPFLTQHYGNPSSIHTFGGSVAKAVEHARQQVADLIGADPKEILFTACGTESDNAAILSAIQTKVDRKKIVTTIVEHPAILEVCKELSRKGYTITYLPVNARGQLDLELAEKEIDSQTAIVSVMWANNETGTLFPVEKLAQIAHKAGALFHTDAVQSVGKVHINMRENEIDFLSLSGHKINAPKGVGALFIRKGTRFRPFIFGGHQEHGRRAGTENVASIVALGVAAELAQKHIENEQTQVKKLRNYLESEIIKKIPATRVNGDLENRLPNTASISFDYIEGEAILLMLDQYGICASSGSACTTGSLEPSHVLRAMGLPYTSAHGTIRFSLSRYTTQEEIDFVLEKLPEIIETLRKVSPYWESV